MAVDDAYTKVLLHFDGSGTTFTDESGKTWTPVANAQLDTSEKVFGTAAGLFDGTGDYISTPYHADFDIIGDFTLDYRIRFAALSQSYHSNVAQMGVAWTGLFVGYTSIWVGNSTQHDFGWTPTLNTWYHVAFTRSGTDLKMFVDGVQQGSTKTSSASVDASGHTFDIAYSNNGQLNGMIDEFRFSNGIARWTANFTSPFAAYPEPHVYADVALDDTAWAQIYTGYLTEDVALDDEAWGQNYTAYLTESVEVSDDLFAMPAMLTENTEFTDTIDAWASIAGPYTQAVELDDVIRGGFEYEGDLTEAVGMNDTHVAGLEYNFALTEGVSVDDEADPGKTETITEYLELVDQATSGWIMNVAETLSLTETVTLKLQLIVQEFLELTETLTSQWAGSETISELLEMWEYAVAVEVFYDTVSEALGLTDVPTALHQMVEAVAESLGIAETSAAGVGFNHTVIETLSVLAAATVFKTIGLTNSESLGLTDTAQPGWQHTIAESLRLTDTSTLAWAAMLTLTESLELTESVLNRFDIDETVAETLGLTVALSMQAALQEVVSETLEFGITIELDDELYECWVLNSNRFNASVYSGYGFNSYCVYNDEVYGAKSTGIYKLTGTTDDGDAFTAGIVLPDTRFGSINQKRFRKAWFGLSGGTTPSIRLETESGSQTYTITSSKANLTRNLKGRSWVVKIQDFDSLDFVSLFPVILTR